MPSFSTRRTVNHTADQMFDLVADMERYPEFLPYCEHLVVRARRSLDDGRETVVADMTVGYKFARETFTSRIFLDRGKQRIDVTAIDGPFRSLANTWQFSEKDAGCRAEVNFQISWEFKNRILGNIVGSLFDRAFRKYTTAFEDRADAIYRAAR